MTVEHEPSFPEPTFLGSPTADRTVGLVMELAAQLHAERHQRMVLEAALRAQGLLDDAALARATADPDVAAAVSDALDLAQRRLLDVITERDDVSGPLRHETATDQPVDGEAAGQQQGQQGRQQ